MCHKYWCPISRLYRGIMKPGWNVQSVILPSVLVLSLFIHLAFWTSIFFPCGERDHKCVSTLPTPGWGYGEVVQKSGLSSLQSKWHVHVSRFLLDSPHLPAGFWIALLCITNVWPFFQSHVAAFRGLCSSWLHSSAGSKLVVDLITHVQAWPLNCWQPLPAARVYWHSLLKSLLCTGNLHVLNHCIKGGVSFYFLHSVSLHWGVKWFYILRPLYDDIYFPLSFILLSTLYASILPADIS